ncbi:MAG: hypothetical protein AAB974_01150 [Patescibacteria group bacterium]
MSTFLEKLKKTFESFRTQPGRVTRVKFLGWKDQELRERFHGSVDLYEQELQTGRMQPRTPPYLFYLKGLKHIPEVGTPPGSELEMWFNPEKLSEERIRTYFKEVGLLVDEATWRVVKDRPSGWFIGIG